MSDLQVVATIPAKPEAADAIREALTTLVAATRAEEGCLAYDLFESASAPGTFVTVERWTDHGGARRPHGDAARRRRLRGRRRRAQRRGRDPPAARPWTDRAGLRESEGPARRAAAQQHRRRHDEQQCQRPDPRDQHERAPPSSAGRAPPGRGAAGRCCWRTSCRAGSYTLLRVGRAPGRACAGAARCGRQPRPTRPLLPAAQQTFATQSTTW